MVHLHHAEQHAMQPVDRVKTYEIVRNSKVTSNHHEIRQDRTPFLWTERKPIAPVPVIEVHTESADGPIIAAVRYCTGDGGMVDVDVVLKDPETAKPEDYIRVARESMWHGTYSFQLNPTGFKYEWRRTREKGLGATWASDADYKLVDATNDDRILAVYIKDTFGDDKYQAHINFMVELGGDLELLAITSIMGIVEVRDRD